MVYMYHSFLIHSSADGHLGCFHVLAMINSAAKILKEMGIPDHLTCLLRNLYAGQEATVRTRHGKMDWFQIGKGVSQCCILSLYLSSCRVHYVKC